jgi:hypothetical protein
VSNVGSRVGSDLTFKHQTRPIKLFQGANALAYFGPLSTTHEVKASNIDNRVQCYETIYGRNLQIL